MALWLLDFAYLGNARANYLVTGWFSVHVLKRGLQMETEPAKMVVKDGWIICPGCRKKKLLRLEPGGSVKRAVAYCDRCRREQKIDIDLSLSP